MISLVFVLLHFNKFLLFVVALISAYPTAINEENRFGISSNDSLDLGGYTPAAVILSPLSNGEVRHRMLTDERFARRLVDGRPFRSSAEWPRILRSLAATGLVYIPKDDAAATIGNLIQRSSNDLQNKVMGSSNEDDFPKMGMDSLIAHPIIQHLTPNGLLLIKGWLNRGAQREFSATDTAKNSKAFKAATLLGFSI